MIRMWCRAPSSTICLVVLSLAFAGAGCVRSPVDPVLVELRWAYLDACVQNKKHPDMHSAFRSENERLFYAWYGQALLDTSNAWHAARDLRDSTMHAALQTKQGVWSEAEARHFVFLWDTLFIDGFNYRWRDTVLATPHVRRAVRFEGQRCFGRIEPIDVDTMPEYVRNRRHVLGLATAGDPPYHHHLLDLVEAGGADIVKDTTGRSAQLRWLNGHGDHVTAYFHGLELSVHAFVLRKAYQDSTCLVQQIQLVALDPCEKPGCNGAEP